MKERKIYPVVLQAPWLAHYLVPGSLQPTRSELLRYELQDDLRKQPCSRSVFLYWALAAVEKIQGPTKPPTKARCRRTCNYELQS